MKQRRVNVRVYGAVQGVGFRAWVRRNAPGGIAGYVRNCPDGSVQVEAEGADALVDALLELLRQGPPHAAVRKVVAQEPGTRPLPEPFTIAF